ncbi:hypothetical protein [Mesorhizobium salmacidum]|uniref:Uncharacterized protein n=1 Tax=Mesorhizobium salmacidum TaxID=3015171 RepID=A0ABU8L6K3_9HYPH
MAEGDPRGVNELLDQSMALITALDVMEADCDLEPSGDELDASATHGWSTGGHWDEDTEQEDSGFGDQDGMNEDCTGEPSLGWTAVLMIKVVADWITGAAVGAAMLPPTSNRGISVACFDHLALHSP